MKKEFWIVSILTLSSVLFGSRLDVGNYVLRLWYLFFAYASGDSVAFDNWIYLSYNAGIEKNKLPDEFDVRIFPNPFNSSCNVSVETQDIASLPAQIVIYDLRGNVVVGAGSLPAQNGHRAGLEPAPTNGARTFIWTPDQSISSGIYLVRVIIDDRRTVMRRIFYLK